MMTFKQATYDHQDQILEIIAQAKAQMAALGSSQWQDGYPAQSDIARDIDRGYGWIFEQSETVVAYGAVVFDGEPAYDAIEGQWLTRGEYVVVHRLAVADSQKGRGVATEFMRQVQTLARSRNVGAFRIDTNFDNRYMLRMLEKLGFAYCGKIHYQSGERLAFEKQL